MVSEVKLKLHMLVDKRVLELKCKDGEVFGTGTVQLCQTGGMAGLEATLHKVPGSY